MLAPEKLRDVQEDRRCEPATAGDGVRAAAEGRASSQDGALLTDRPQSPDEQFSSPTPKPRVPVEKRGGRPRTTGPTPSADSSAVEKKVPVAHRRHHPELVCWRQGMNWAVGVELGEGSIEDSPGSWIVTQTSILPEDQQRPGRWVLTNPLDGVELVRGDGHDSFSFPSETFRIFKLVGSQHERGRRLKSLTRGRFLVVTPQDWEVSAGHEIVAPEYALGASCRAHHLEVSHPLAGSVVFDTPNGQLTLPTQAPGFELEGVVLPDRHPEAGPLFHGSPPHLRSLRNITYGTVVVGEEGRREGTRGWRVRAADFEELRPQITSRRAGWFFVRLYDDNDDLIDSLDFRFSVNLEAIELDAVPPVPAADGHHPARVRLRFAHGANCKVEPAGTGVDERLFPMREQDDSYTIEIPPLPDFDETRWRIQESDGAQVDICLRVERLWWSLADETSPPDSTEWRDRQLELRPADLAATSRQVLRVRLPIASLAGKVEVGVEPDRCVALDRIPGRPRERQVPLRALGRFSDPAKPAVNAELKLWITPEGGDATDRWEAVVGRICTPQRVPDPRPTPALCLQSLKPPRVMTVLTNVRHRCGCFRHKRVIDQLRRVHYTPGRHRRHRDRAKREDFLCRALCVLALIIEEHAPSAASPLVSARWARRAQLARSAFPDVFEAVRATVPGRPALFDTRLNRR